MACKNFSEEGLPLLSPAAVIEATGNPDACPRTLRQKCVEFQQRLRKAQGQLRHQVKELSLPMTHCTVCWRACDGVNLEYAELAYGQAQPSSRLQRITGSVFSRLCGHASPYCCDATLHSTDVLETFVRYDGAREVHEVPFNPGCSPEYCHVGGSLRLLPTASLDPLTAAWQVKHGYDAKPFYEMHLACVALRGAVVKLSPARCTLGFCDRVSVEAEICDFSRRFSRKGSDVVCMMGQLSVHFHEGGERKSSLTLPSKRSVLAVIPTCRKGSTPLINGTHAYIKRRHEQRPNVAYIVDNASDGLLECSILCQDEFGERRSFLMEARRRAKAEGLGRKGCVADVNQTELHFFVRSPRSETTPEAKQADDLKRSVTGRGKAAREAPEMVPLLAWLLWLLRSYDDTWTTETVQEELASQVKKALREELDCAPPELYVDEILAMQVVGRQAYEPRSKKVKKSAFLVHVPDEADAKMEVLATLLAKALAVQLMQRPADTLPSTKSMNSASDIWQGLLRKAFEEALSAALKKSLGALERKCVDAEGTTTAVKVLHYEYSGSFLKPDAVLHEKCYRKGSSDGKSVRPQSSVIVIDAFSQHSCASLSHDLELGFHFLHEQACGWNLISTRCPMCRVEYDPRYNPEDTDCCRCHVCAFNFPSTHQSLDLCRVVTHRKLVGKPTSLLENDVKRQKLFFSLDVAKHVALGAVGYSFLCKALKGHDEMEVGSVVAPGTENSAKGTNGRRGNNLQTDLHENLIDGRSGKDSNPDLRVYLLTGSSLQRRPSVEELRVLNECVHSSSVAWQKAVGNGRLEVRGRTVLRYDAHDVGTVLTDVRRAVHRAAELCGNAELATCCPVLSYGSAGPVVTLRCSGSELVRAVGWRALTPQELAALEALAHKRAFSSEGLPESWKMMGEGGLTWDMLVNAGVVTYTTIDRHIVLKEDSADLTGPPDGLTFYKISPELESAMRILQTEDAASWNAGHAVRMGYSSGMALNAHKPEPLAHGNSISSIRSVGSTPCKSNMRNLVGSAPDNQYGSTLKFVALLHNFGTAMQEDSFPESVDAFRHLTFRNKSLFFVARTHWESNPHAVPTRHIASLLRYVDRKSGYRKDVAACLDDVSGVVKRPWTFVKSGQALCFVLGGAKSVEGDEGVSGDFLYLAPCDMWVKTIKVEPLMENGETAYKYEVRYLMMDMYDEGQKLGKLYQKFVSMLLEDWISGGRGRVTGLLSSSSISSRTAVQNLTRAWMTSLALASGVGNLDLVTRLSDEASLVRDFLQSSRPLSASALTELRRRTPGSSVSNQGPMVSGRQGRYFGSCIQVMMSVLVAVQDASKPNGSINGINEAGKMSPGKICLDPIMTVLWRGLGFEQHEDVLREGACSACSFCGKYSASGQCDCADEKGQKRPKRDVNVNSAFRTSSASLACLNIDVCVEWENATGGDLGVAATQVEPESAEWLAVPSDRGSVSMLDAQRREPAERRAEKASCRKKVVDGRGIGLSFGPSPVGRVVADQFVFAMRALKRRAVWDSGDHTDGYTVVAHGDLALFVEAVEKAAHDVGRFKQCLMDFKLSSIELPLNSMTAIGGGMSLGAEVGGTLQLHTSDERTKQVVIGAMAFANSAKRVFRAFLVEAPVLELRPLKNPGYSAKETCNEQELRLEFERNVLGYLYLATTLATLPLRRCFHRDATVVRAELHLVPGCPHVSASQIFGEDGERLFFKDVVLGANPLARGWCSTTKLLLKFVVYAARVEHYPTAWQKVQGISESLEAAAPLQEIRCRMDAALTSSPPALNGIDQRPVFEVVVKDTEAFKAMDPSVCGYGVLNYGNLKTGSMMHCVDCKDCVRYHDTSVKSVAASIKDIEDTAVGASSYFRRIDVGNRKRIFEQGGGWKARRVRGSPLSIVPQADLWAFRCYTDEDVSSVVSALPPPSTLEEFMGVGNADLLRGMSDATTEELAAEKVFLEDFWKRRGGASAWVQKAHAAVQLLLESADELERDLLVLGRSLRVP